MDGMLSQEEINALLGSMAFDDDEAGQGITEETLTPEEQDAIGEISNINMGTAATTLYSLVSRRVTITTPVVSYATWDDVVANYDRPCVFIQISYKQGLDGNNILVLKEKDVKVITDLMMGGDGTNTDVELGELHLSAISEAMNQMMGSSATSLSSMLNKKIDISPPTACLINLEDAADGAEISEFLAGRFVKIGFKMEIEGLVDSEIMQLYPFEFAIELYNRFKETMSMSSGGTQDEPAEPQMMPTPQPQPETVPEMGMQMPEMEMQMPNMGGQMPNMGMQMPNMGMQMPNMGMQMPNMGMQMPNMGMQMPNMGMQTPYMQPNVNVQQAQFQSFSNNVNIPNNPENINLIMDVPLEVTVELGRTTKSIHDILEFSPGTIIELNKIAGEPVDVLVNGKFVAKGEVVVIEENFGIRITEIL
ncbi:flagellar motor switch phosphatase FliY [Anaerobium acetethylicum]|uniref:Flagellar motor switch protein FliN/FliY n=1 Tax=Anaerobium acetethylicum TaxID=1619234 RepID=A0A1D3TQL8_9FIRM|nr:flagellar motor switch phosphatase FliY [Anaerobium acetethylicum]SCP95922.1 flagellar motor switch protein FliN/FliY [Anaerobium acetethylicum]